MNVTTLRLKNQPLCADFSTIEALSAHASSAGQGSPAALALAVARHLDAADPRRAALVRFALAERGA
jgi:hypothetical protein